MAELKEKLLKIIKEPHVLSLILITLICIGWIFANGGIFGGALKFGIDFSGGLRIPVLLAHPVDQVTMQQLIENIKIRTSTFGLSEIKITPIGDSEIDIEVSKLNKDLVLNIERILSLQGVFEGIVDGKIVLKGEDIYSESVRQLNPANYNKDWAVGFSLTRNGQQKFAAGVKGKANYPIYMFLDRPKEGIIIIKKEHLDNSLKNFYAQRKGSNISLSKTDLLKTILQLSKIEQSNLNIYLEEDISSLLGNNSLSNSSFSNPIVILSNSTSNSLKQSLIANGFKLVEKTDKEMTPSIEISENGFIFINQWEAMGLKSSAILSPEVTSGYGGGSYIISGMAEGYGEKRALDATFKAKELISVLKGGALPVGLVLGSIQEVPAVFGEKILELSLLGLVLAVIFISIFIAIRYRELKIVLPIIFISVSEMIILLTLIGMFSIDLAAMAGIIAATGISVDAQIVMTDVFLKKRKENPAQALKYSHEIITTNALVAILAFLPLVLFSGLVEIIGFGTTTILGYLLGVFISRPAYNVFISNLLE